MTPQEDLVLRSRAPILAAKIEAKNKEVAAKISQAYAEASRELSNALGYTICAGLMMIERKSELPHGEFLTWLEKYCPEIHRMTATRFMNAALSAVTCVLGPEAAKPEMSHRVTFDGAPLYQILSADPTTLTKEARDVQNQFRDFLAGKTQHQLLLDWRAIKSEDKSGGARTVREPTAEEVYAAKTAQAEQLVQQLIMDITHFIIQGDTLQFLSDATRKKLLDTGEEMNGLLRAVRPSAKGKEVSVKGEVPRAKGKGVSAKARGKEMNAKSEIRNPRAETRTPAMAL